MATTVRLVKTCRETHLAHLYEHLYLYELCKFFDENKLFEYLDYELEGYTYGGYVLLDITTCTDMANRLLDRVAQLKVSTGTVAISKIIILMATEEEYSLAGNLHTIKDGLTTLNQQPWSTLNDIDFYRTGTQNRESLRWHKSKVINAGKTKIRTKRLQSRLTLDYDFSKKNQSLVPLFHVIATVLQTNLVRELAWNYQYYYNSTTGLYNGRIVRLNYLFDAWLKHQPVLTTELSTCESTIRKLFQRDILNHIVTFLQKADYTLPHESPNEEELVFTMNMLVGAAGWHKLADIDKVLAVVKHSTFELRYGKQKQSFKLADLLS